ncbi:uncharacterized protein [Callorhinus ursinus]|uniref:uncharacterized protein n=1 Tax=Callorhinus ursinus TaxID=34884 RepID=UPI003CCFFAE7
MVSGEAARRPRRCRRRKTDAPQSPSPGSDPRSRQPSTPEGALRPRGILQLQDTWPCPQKPQSEMRSAALALGALKPRDGSLPTCLPIGLDPRACPAKCVQRAPVSGQLSGGRRDHPRITGEDRPFLLSQTLSTQPAQDLYEELNETMPGQLPAQCLARSRCSLNLSCDGPFQALSTPRGLGSGRSCSTAPPADSQHLAEPPGTGALSLPEISSVTAQAAEPRAGILFSLSLEPGSRSG